ncbi:hypothetical protein [Paenibacillus gallinarum]|uniref:Uncharacterized protein n=1 Tax=Paenibacillus gallinarum TaxID=2762232 RepID=A0ABR8T008_9BACL|nr:hypothetical protein [Paenibacillus gallinarum]MBD7969093.1 hypothetical protein [Paenibacillus gallinarum]
MTDHQPNNKNTPPQEGPSDDVDMDELERNQSTSSSQPYYTYFKQMLYIGVAIIIAFVLVSLLSAIGFNVFVITLNLSTAIQWTTSYILPWIFLYYFIQFVRAFVKGKQG